MDGRIRELEHAIATDPGDPEARDALRALLRRIANLGDRVAWGAADACSQDLVIAALARQLAPAFRHIGTNVYAAGGESHRIAAFSHVESGAQLQLLPGGRYQRGGQGELRLRELPRHEVLTRPFLIGRMPLLQVEWDRVPGQDVRSWRRAELAIDGVSWDGARAWLSAAGGLRLPSEAEWEFACRAGTTSAYFWGEEPDAAYAWFGSGGAEWETRAPALHAEFPNAFGLVDPAGNLAEWCEDHYVGDYHGAPRDGSARRELKGDLRVVRGGDTYNGSSHCRSAARNLASRGVQAGGIGFRVAASLVW